MKNIDRIGYIAVILALAVIISIGLGNNPNDTIEAKETSQTALVWFEDLAAIDGVPINGSVPLTDGVYTATLIDGSDMQIVVTDGYWYFQ